ncbi:hypothetical protein ACFO9Q_22620 [Paenibacillus sp. GCM10023252]|uniref:hypothetical protein n=1 Tax=Paenibacillus sp. GCM10023252 TaxID=3252649 RepID=UPI0036103608
MTRKIGIFSTEQQVIDTVTELQREGFAKSELRVFAKDYEHSRRIETETHVHADEVLELIKTRNERDHSGGPDILLAAGTTSAPYIGGSAGVYGGGGAGYNVAPGIVAGNLAGAMEEVDSYSQALRTLGLSNSEASTCGEAIHDGRYVVVVETDSSASLVDQDGGPDLSRLSTAEAVYRRTGATTIA